MTTLLIRGLGSPDLLIILGALLLMFGSSKLPELARGTGRALRIFKAETAGLTDGKDAAPETSPVEARRAELDRLQAELDAERAQLHRDS